MCLRYVAGITAGLPISVKRVLGKGITNVTH